jgi:hypothetical protein
LKARHFATLALLASLSILGACKKANPHDNTRPPDPYTDKPVQNHRFDGGESDPYYKPGEGGGEGGGEKAAKE